MFVCFHTLPKNLYCVGLLPPMSAVDHDVIESVLSMCVRVCVIQHSHGGTGWCGGFKIGRHIDQDKIDGQGHRTKVKVKKRDIHGFLIWVTSNENPSTCIYQYGDVRTSCDIMVWHHYLVISWMSVGRKDYQILNVRSVSTLGRFYVS